MPNVLGLVSFRVFPTHMGGQKGVALFYKYLQQHLKVLLAVSVDNVETDVVPVKRMLHPNKKIYLNFFRKEQLKQLIRSGKIDIVLAEHSYTGWIAWLIQRSTGKPFIIHSHNIESRRFQQMHKWWWKLYQWYEGWIHRKARHNFFISEEDLNFAVQHFKLKADDCSVITYGIEQKSFYEDRKLLRKKLGLDENKLILLFNGTLDYKPNYEAVEIIIETIEPLLRTGLKNYEIIITGNRAQKKLIEKILSAQNINYLGYVDDVDDYYQAADLFINPVSNNTGVKTKLIEAIANRCTAVSTESGAWGIRKEVCGDKLVTTADRDWKGFVEKIIEYIARKVSTPQEFYDFYSWENISEKASKKILEFINE